MTQIEFTTGKIIFVLCWGVLAIACYLYKGKSLEVFVGIFMFITWANCFFFFFTDVAATYVAVKHSIATYGDSSPILYPLSLLIVDVVGFVLMSKNVKFKIAPEEDNQD